MILELQRFLLTAQNGNITKSAEKMFITQSALTQSIQRLEKNLGTKLFVQKGKYLQLTADGKAVESIAGKIVSLWDTAKNPELRKKQTDTYTIGMFDNAALRLGPFIEKKLNTHSPTLELTIEGSTSLLTKLALGVLDIAIGVISQKTVLPKNISLVQTFYEDLIPVSSKKFSMQPEAIPFIFYNKQSHTREQTDKVFEEKNIKPLIFAESTSTTFMKELALLGSGIALLPKNFVRAEIAQGTLIKQKLPLSWKRAYGIYINSQGTLNKNHPLIKELVREFKESK